MSRIYVFFGVRLKTPESLTMTGQRVGRILGCTFVASSDPDYPNTTIMEAESFCLRLVLSERKLSGPEKMSIHQLNGENLIEPRWDYSNEINLTPWLLEELQRRDSPDWYVPTLEELKGEAGIL